MTDNPSKLLVVLDIDETLIHATTREDRGEPDFYISDWKIYRRPHLQTFLDYCFQNFHVGVWTSAGCDYARLIMDEISEIDRLQFIWASDRCTRAFNQETYDYYPRKHLSKLVRYGWNRDRILAIDDTPSKWEKSYGNYLRVEPFKAEPDDNELPLLIDYLESIKDEPTMRNIEKRQWRKKVS